MDRVVPPTALSALVEPVIKSYVRPSMDGLLVYVSNAKQQTYGVVWLTGTQRIASHLALMVRIVEEKVIIHADNPDYPVLDELLRAGITREQIHLVLKGEAGLIPENQRDADFESSLI